MMTAQSNKNQSGTAFCVTIEILPTLIESFFHNDYEKPDF